MNISSMLNIMLICLGALKACVPKLCVLSCIAACLVCVMTVTSCDCQLDFNKGLLLLLLLLLLFSNDTIFNDLSDL